MHIIHVINEPTGGGAELLVRELNQRLQRAGFKSHVLYLTNPKNVRLHSSEYCLELRSVRSISAPYKLWRFLQKFVEENVIVHAHLTYPLYYLGLMPRPRNTALLYTEHNTYNRRRAFSAFRPLERYVYARFDRIACISEGVRASLLEWIGYSDFEKRVTIVLNGARLFKFTGDRSSVSTGLIAVSVGSLTSQKGFDMGLEALSLVADVVTRYTIVGDGPEKERLEYKAKSLGVAGQLHLPGWQEEIEPWFQDADIMVIPSRWEGFGLVAIEALSTGLPVVASDVAGLREILSGCEAAFLVDPEKPAGLAEAIRTYASKTANEKRRLAERARVHAEAYSLEAMTASYARLYERLDNG